MKMHWFRRLRTLHFEDIAFLQERRVSDSSSFTYSLRRQLLANESGAPTDGEHVSLLLPAEQRLAPTNIPHKRI